MGRQTRSDEIEEEARWCLTQISDKKEWKANRLDIV
jgi:hypothetical protein